jgi:hypothetical protein
VVARSLFAIWVGLWCEIMIFKFGEVDVYGIPWGQYSNKHDFSGWFEGPACFEGLAVNVCGDP